MTNQQLAIYLLNEQYKHVGLTFEQITKLTPEQFENLSITEAQYLEWYTWALQFVMKRKRWNKKYAQSEIAMLDFYAGIRVNYDRTN